MTFKSTKSGFPKLEAFAVELDKLRLVVGVTEDKNARTDSTTATNSVIGYSMEFGLPDKNVPARPHLVLGIQDAQPDVIHQLGVGAVAVAFQDMSAVRETLDSAGDACVKAIVARIDAGQFEPLAASTVKARLAKGNESVKPLVDTGQYRSSISYEVREK